MHYIFSIKINVPFNIFYAILRELSKERLTDSPTIDWIHIKPPILHQTKPHTMKISMTKNAPKRDAEVKSY